MKRMQLFVYVVISILFIGFGYLYGEIKYENNASEYKEKLINVELIYKIGSDKENEDFYEPNSFAVDLDERIYVLDRRNSRVQCFSKEGKFILSFGRYGQGPGELSKYAEIIRILEDQNIYIIDLSRKINVYDRNGKFIKSMKVDDEYNDIEMIDGKYYLSNCYMETGRKTIHVIDNSGKKVESFGIIIEPEEGIINKINKEGMKEVLDSFFNSSGFSQIVRTNNKELIYSLCIPYRLIKYDVEGRVLRDVSGNIEYGKKEKFSIVHKDGYPFIMPNLPLPLIYSPIVKDDDTILVPFLKKERDYLYIDHYDNELNFIQRYRIAERIAKDGSIIQRVYIDKKNNLYCLVRPLTSDDLPHIVKYRLLM
jgi:hypothetical protein